MKAVHRNRRPAALPFALPALTTVTDLRAFIFLCLSSLLLWTLAYQVPLTVHLAVGGDWESHRREDDAPFLRGFNASEPASETTWEWWTLEPGYSYRWAQQDATIELPGVGGGLWLVTLYAGSGRPDNAAAASRWQLDQQTALPLLLPATARHHQLVVQAPFDGDLTLHLQTDPYSPPDDPRDLGFTLREVQVVSATNQLRLPALVQIGWLLLAVALIYGLVRWLILTVRRALLLTSGLVVLIALLLAWQRLALTLLTPYLVMLLVGCWGLAGIAWLAVGGRRTGGVGWWGPPQNAAIPTLRLFAVHRQFAAVVALVLLAFALRAGGMLHPHAIFSDHRLNANNLLEVGLGNIYITEGLPDSRGGGQAPYPPGLYLLLAPLLTFSAPDIDSRVLIVQLGTALLDSLVVLLLWLLLRRAGIGQRAAILGAALYVLPPPMMASFSIGEYANIGGQALALPVLALLALGGLHTGQRQSWGLFALLLGIGLLGHFGVAISLSLAMGAIWLVALALLLERSLHPAAQAPNRPLALLPLTAGGALAALAVGLIYYSAPLFVYLFGQRLAESPLPTATPAPAPLDALMSIVIGLFAPGSRLLPLTAVLGFAGLLLIWEQISHTVPAGRERAVTAGSLAATLLGWWLGLFFSFGLLLVATQGVRWQHFIYPALCLGSGWVFAAILRRGTTGRLITGVIVAFLIGHGLTQWIWQLYDYLH